MKQQTTASHAPRRKASILKNPTDNESRRSKSRQRSNSFHKSSKNISNLTTQITSERNNNNGGSLHKRKDSNANRKGNKIIIGRQSSKGGRHSKKRNRESMDMTNGFSKGGGDGIEMNMSLRKKRGAASRGCSPNSTTSHHHDFSNDKSRISSSHQSQSRKQQNNNTKTTPFRNQDKHHHHHHQTNDIQFYEDQNNNMSRDNEDELEYQNMFNTGGVNNNNNSHSIKNYQKSLYMDTSQASDQGENNNNLRCDGTRVENFFETEYREAQKELLQTKSKIYEYRYKVDSLKKKLLEADACNTQLTQKFEKEQSKSDEFFAKQEKYKLLCRDFKKEVQKMSKQVENLERKKDEDNEYFERTIKNIEESERMRNNEMKIDIKNTFILLGKLEKGLSKTNLNQHTLQHFNDVYESLKKLGDTQLGNNTNHPVDTEQNQTSYYIGDGMTNNKFKVSSDAIVYNGESLGDESVYIGGTQNNNCLGDNGGGVNDYSVDSTPVKMFGCGPLKSHQASSQQSNSNYMIGSSKVHRMHGMDQSKMILQSQDASLSCNQSSGDNNNVHYDLLLKIQSEMQKVKEESQKVLNENSKLVDKNTFLQSQLSSDKQRMEQSLLPQYKEAFEQMRMANEMLEKKIEDLTEDKVGESKLGQDSGNELMMMKNEQREKIEEQIQEMRFRMQKYEYENTNLKDEREMFLHQINNLETYNKTQEKMISYFQQTYNSVMQSMQFQSQQNPQTQPISNSFSLNSTNQIIPQSSSIIDNGASSNNNNNQGSFDLKGYMNQKLSYPHSVNSNNMNEKQQYSRDNNNKQRSFENTQVDITQLDNLEQSSLLNIGDLQSQPYFSNRSNATSQNNNHQIMYQNQQEQQQQQQQQQYQFLLEQQQNNQYQKQQQQINKQQYSDNCGFDINSRSEYAAGNEKEDLFSLSSTQPEGQMRLLSPLNTFVPKQIDFSCKQSQVVNSTVNATTPIGLKDLNIRQSQNMMNLQQQKLYPPTTTSQQNKKQQLYCSNIEELKSEQQDETTSSVSNRTKSVSNQSKVNIVNGMIFNYNQNIEQSDINRSYHKSSSQQSQEDYSNNHHGVYEEEDIQSEKMYQQRKQQPPPQQQQQYQNEYLCSQETFNVKESLKNNYSDNASTSKMSSERTNQSQNINNKVAKDKENNNLSQAIGGDKENQKQQMFQDPLNHSFNGTNGYQNVKSPTFIDPDQSDTINDLEDSVDHNNITSSINNIRNKQQQFSNSSLSKSRKSNEHFPNQSKGHPFKESSINQTNGGGSISSNFMSERTLNLKKEITSLDDEILQLQNSLKQALMRKGNDCE